MLENERILVTGATGQVARPIAEQLNANNQVWAAARFSDADAKAALEAQGIECVKFTMGDQDLAHLPDVDYVIHCAASVAPETPAAGIEGNAVGTGFLMQRYKDAKAFFHMSSASVYKDMGDPEMVYPESSNLGGYSAYSPHYAMSKLTSESVVEFQSRALNLPTVISRLEVAYGTQGHGGLPVVLFMLMKHGMAYQKGRGRDSWCSLIHEDDIVRQVQGMCENATVPPLVVNLCGDEFVTLEEIITFLETESGLTMTIEEADEPAWETKKLDQTLRTQVGGPCQVPWREGVKSAVVAHFPDAF